MFDVEKLRLAIRGKYLTDKAFANKIGLSAVELSKYLNKKKKLDMPVAKKIVNELELTDSELRSIFFS